MIINTFSKTLLKWNKSQNSRSMPWKGEKDPYRIWLSEIILQQTRVEQGWEYYTRFITTFPSVKELALASDKEVFKLWEGLGYYSRCRNLIATARHIYQERNSVFPQTYEEILKLKGVGPYTAAAIASFSYNLPYAVVDGNVQRVLARIFGIEDPIDSTSGKKRFHALAQELLDKKNPAIYNQAIMDFGATVCKPLQPLCSQCPFASDCVAFKENKIAQFPVKSKKLIIKNRYFYFFFIRCRNKIAIRERLTKDIWQHLHEFPLMELEKEGSLNTALDAARQAGWFHAKDFISSISNTYKQKLTHQHIHAVFITVQVGRMPSTLKNYDWVEADKLAQYSFPKVINDFLKTAL